MFFDFQILLTKLSFCTMGPFGTSMLTQHTVPRTHEMDLYTLAKTQKYVWLEPFSTVYYLFEKCSEIWRILRKIKKKTFDHFLDCIILLLIVRNPCPW